MTEALFYTKREHEEVQCRLCPHTCLIKPEKRGYCGVRKNISGKLYALTSGRVISAVADPVEKKPLYHFFPGSRAYSLGGFGCNLACRHCQNHTISQVRDEVSFSMLQKMPSREIIENALAGKCKMIAWTYNEPTIWYEYIFETSKLAREKGLKTVLITNGVINKEPLLELLPFIDAYRIDVKGFTDDFYKQLTGFPFLKTVMESGETAFAAGCHVEVVTNIIPNWNDGKEHIEGISTWIKEKLDPSVPWHITAYHRANKLSEKDTPSETLISAKKTALKIGLNHIYLGNIYTENDGNTLCPECGNTLIRRYAMSMERNITEKGCCPQCHSPLKMYRDEGI